MVVLSVEQKRFWDDNGYVIWDEPLLSPERRQALAQRLEDLARGRMNHVPEEMFRFEKSDGQGGDDEETKYNRVRTIAFLHKYDDLVRSISQSSTILDIVEDLLGPNIKLYTDQFFMKPPFHGTAQVWHQDSETWTFFAPHDHVTCWIAIDEATEKNGCLHYLAGSHTWGYLDTAHIPNLREQLKDTDVSVPRKPGYGVFHHSLTLHQTGPNTTPNRRRGIALHYIWAETRYIGNPGDRQPPFLLMRGREIQGRV